MYICKASVDNLDPRTPALSPSPSLQTLGSVRAHVDLIWLAAF